MTRTLVSLFQNIEPLDPGVFHPEGTVQVLNVGGSNNEKPTQSADAA